MDSAPDHSVGGARLPEWGIALLLAFASLLWSAIAITTSPGLSRYDEWTYVDYAYQVSNGHIPIQGDDLSDYARQAWSCRGMEGYIRGVTPPPCDEVSDHAVTDWPFEGENYNTFHPPLYFAFAGGVALGLSTVGVDFTDGARIASALLGAAGAACLYLAIRTWSVRRRHAVGATLIAMSAPALAQSAAIVHNDAISMLAGAAAVWLAARIFRNNNDGWALPFLVTAVISATRTMSVIAVLAVGVVAFFVAIAHRDSRWQRLKPVLGIGVGTALPYVLWTAFQNSRRPEDYVPSITGLSTEPFELGDSLAVLNTIVGGGAPWGLTSPSGDWYLHPDLNSGLLEGWSWILYGTFLVLLPIALYIAIKSRGSVRYLAVLVLLLPAFTALIVQGREILSNGAYFRAISGRYAITAVPVYVTFLAVLAEKYVGPKKPESRDMGVGDNQLLSWVLPGLGVAGYSALLLSPFL